MSINRYELILRRRSLTGSWMEVATAELPPSPMIDLLNSLAETIANHEQEQEDAGHE